MLELRPYQKQFINDIRNKFRAGHRRVCGVMPCGAGKTLATADMTKKAAAKGNRTVFMVHRKELIDQTSKTFNELGIEHGIIAAGVEPKYELPVQIASVQTLFRRLDKIQPPNFLIVDECHHILADTYMKIVKRWDCHMLGLTATPIRMGGITLYDSFDCLVEGPSVKKLIAEGFLSNFEYINSTRLDLSGLKIKRGEYTKESMNALMDHVAVTNIIVKNYLEVASDKKAICYCVDIEHSKHVANFFQQSGVRAEHFDSTTPAVERADIIERFRSGDIKVLCNVELIGEGFDVPDMECVILARPTKSLTLFIQQSMRPLRPDPLNPNKKALIIDHVNNVKNFGMIDEKRDWSLKKNVIKEKDTSNAPFKECFGCGELIPLAMRACPYCGYEFLNDAPVRINYDMHKIYDSSEKTLSTIDYYLLIAEERGYKKGWAAIKALMYARSLDDCIEIADACGYKKGWAYHNYNELDKYRSKNTDQHVLRSHA